MRLSPAIVVLGPSALPAARRIRDAIEGARIHGARARIAPADLDVGFDDAPGHLRALLARGQPIIALCAAGIVIRALAPSLRDKRQEPPVIAIAEDGSVAIPLLGGHHGANQIAREVASVLGGTAAITTAGDVRYDLALDDPPPGFAVRNPEAAKPVMAALLEGAPVALRVEAGDADWLVASGAPFAATGERRVLITDRDRDGGEREFVIHPKVLALGVGCERSTDPSELHELVLATLEREGLARQALACIASIELKADEPAVHTLAARLGLPARFFSAAELEVEAPRLLNPSAVVFAATGCHGVAEGAALAAAGPGAVLVVAKTRSARATCAVARAPRPIDPALVGRLQGRLAIVGIGPGSAGWRTAEAVALIEAAEDWVGYAGYLDLVESLRRNQRSHPFRLGEEEERCRAALDLAASGRRVALISSGDAGIYAMAALVFEILERGGDAAWQRIAIEVSPGVSALQAAAARVGAPLGHDFCAISLSDLLTPWSEIERRIKAAAKGDFVTALYNPASRTRRAGLARALAILADARAPETPIVHARNLGRPGEALAVGLLSAFDPAPVDMMSLLIVGSSRTRLGPLTGGERFVYTPRGYFGASKGRT
jgi:cobalt-precorrin 5A hydrolase / precorrin-3B C17-methyltransferase